MSESSRKPTALAVVVRSAIDEAGKTVTEVAAELGIQRTTLCSRLNAQNPVRGDKPRDVALVRRIAKAIGREVDELLTEAKEMGEPLPTKRPAKPTAPDFLPELIDLLLAAHAGGTGPEHIEAAGRILKRLAMGEGDTL